MIDWLAEQYVMLMTRAAVFVENPTACPWIGFFQASALLLVTAWFSRTAYFAFQAYRVRRLGTVPDSSAERHKWALRLGAALGSVGRKVASLAGSRRARQVVESWRLRTYAGPGPMIFNLGFVRPRIFVSKRALEILDDQELDAAVAHELAHVLHRDNLKRAVAEGICFVAPVALWWWAALPLVVGSPAQFLGALTLGLAGGALLRIALLPALAYWQERRCDEWAARAVGDRLAVASALIKIARACKDLPGRVLRSATSFAFYRSPVSTRVRRLVSGKGELLFLASRWVRTLSRVLAVGLVLLSFLAMDRARRRGLSGHLILHHCQVDLALAVAANPAPGPSGKPRCVPSAISGAAMFCIG